MKERRAWRQISCVGGGMPLPEPAGLKAFAAPITPLQRQGNHCAAPRHIKNRRLTARWVMR
jgi:hypothetical protein